MGDRSQITPKMAKIEFLPAKGLVRGRANLNPKNSEADKFGIVGNKSTSLITSPVVQSKESFKSLLNNDVFHRKKNFSLINKRCEGKPIGIEVDERINWCKNHYSKSL
jgi:hypothetical protein